MLSISSCDENHPPPPMKVCTTSVRKDFLCFDPTLDTGKEHFTEEYATGRIVLDKDAFNSLYGYCSNLREDLIKCERKKKSK